MPRNEIADALELKWTIARILDQATVELLIATSPADAVIRAAYEDRSALPAYDDTPGIRPTDVLKTCRCCGQRFWSRTSGLAVFCSTTCYRRDRERSDPASRERRLAWHRAYNARRPDRRRAG